jgi:hypothetical protein
VVKTINAINPQVTVTAVPGPGGAPFNGTTVFTNIDNGASVRGFSIAIGPGVAAGCEDGEVKSAVSFVLDDLDWKGDPFPDPRLEGRPTTFLQVWELNISAPSDPLCNAIEIIRTPDYTAAFTDITDELPATEWKFNAETNVIEAGSYEEIGILIEGAVKLGEPINNPPFASKNVIGAPACAGQTAAVAIMHGPTYNLDGSLKVEAVVTQNTIDMTNGCGVSGTGILLIGEPGGSQTEGTVNNNDISGAYRAVILDENMNSANFKANSFNGDPGSSDDIAICSEVITPGTKGKPNSFSGYGPNEKIQVGGCISP